MMAANIPLDEDHIAWINSYAAEVRETFGAKFREAADRFACWKPLLQRFSGSALLTIAQGTGLGVYSAR